MFWYLTPLKTCKLVPISLNHIWLGAKQFPHRVHPKKRLALEFERHCQSNYWLEFERAHGHSRECPRRECPLARAHGHTRVPGPCTLARVRHAPASAHGTLASFYTLGSQRRPGAQQPETDGVRAQRLGLRFAASVAAVLALAVVRSSLARAHGLARVPRHTTQALPAVRMRCSLPPV